MWEPEAVASWGGYYTMLEEVNQTRVGKESNSYLLLERKFAAKPENYNNIVLEFEYPEPADPTKLTNTERVP